PLRALASPPASHVKWLTKREQHWLFNYLGGPADEEDAEELDGQDEQGPWKGGLAGEERFGLAFWLTLLRADVFGAAQASIVARLRKRVAGSAAIEQAMAEVGDAAYTAAAAAYADLRKQLHVEILAALAVLMEAGAAEAVILLEHLGGQQAVRSVIGSGGAASTDEEESIADAVRKEIAPALRAALSDPGSVPVGAGRELLLEAVSATPKVSRMGFRREDRAGAGMLAALQSGAPAIVEAIAELDRLTATLSQKAATGDVQGDRARFLAAFTRIYFDSKDQ